MSAAIAILQPDAHACNESSYVDLRAVAPVVAIVVDFLVVGGRRLLVAASCHCHTCSGGSGLDKEAGSAVCKAFVFHTYYRLGLGFGGFGIGA